MTTTPEPVAPVAAPVAPAITSQDVRTAEANQPPYVVTRAICMGGARVEVGTVIELAKNLANELMTAGKVAHYVAPPVPAEQPKPVRAKEKAVAPVAEPQAELIA